MKPFRKIVSFGDSFAWGDELIAPEQTAVGDHGNRQYREQHCYTGVLAKHYDVPAQNLAFPGGSCQSTRWIYTWWLQREPDPSSCLVLVQLSGPWRSSQFDNRRVLGSEDYPWNKFVHSAWVDHYLQHDQTVADYFLTEQKFSDCKERSDLVQAETYLFFQGQQPNTAGLLMFNSQKWNFNHCVLPNCLLWHGQCLVEILRDSNYFKPQKHLSEIGHERVSALLIEQIDHAILTV